MSPSTINAVVRLLVTSATSTARAPTTNAPMIGTKPPKKVSTANGRASGTPRTTSPMPIRTASIRPTAACPWMKLPNVTQERLSTVSRCRPARSPTTPPSHGKKFGPSLMKKKASTKARAAVTRPEPTALTPARTLEASALALPCNRVVICCTAAFTWASLRFSGGPVM